jgi:hypothetical protein
MFDPPLTPETIQFADATRTSFLAAGLKIQPGTVYNLHVEAVSDCAGNHNDAPAPVIRFALPEPAQPGDIILNEVLFNPRPTGSDFIEIFNTSSRFINLKAVSVATGATRYSVAAVDILLEPGSYAAITEDVPAVANEYPNAPIAALHAIDELPSMNDDEGTIHLFFDGGLIDQFTYSSSFHSPFLKDNEGVSLERLFPDMPTDDPQNWKSGSGDAGYATPGYRNSNFSQPLFGAPNVISLTPAVFDPLGGTPSFTTLQYAFDRAGYVGNIRIYDDRGRLVKTLADNLPLGTGGALRWDGDTDSGGKARIGYYLVMVEIFDATGAIRRYRETVAIAAPF